MFNTFQHIYRNDIYKSHVTPSHASLKENTSLHWSSSIGYHVAPVDFTTSTTPALSGTKYDTQIWRFRNSTANGKVGFMCPVAAMLMKTTCLEAETGLAVFTVFTVFQIFQSRVKHDFYRSYQANNIQRLSLDTKMVYMSTLPIISIQDTPSSVLPWFPGSKLAWSSSLQGSQNC